MVNILFVCVGDTCRSTMASAIFKHYIKQFNLTKKVRCSSAGLNVAGKEQINPKAKVALKILGVQSPSHYSTQVTLKLLSKQAKVVTVCESYKTTILNVCPTLTNVVSLKEYAVAEDVVDPFGQSQETYNETAKYLKYAVEKVFNRVCKEYNL